LHNRDIRILNTIKNNLKFGRIKTVNNKPYSIFIVSDSKNMKRLINKINGNVRLKKETFEYICIKYDIKFIEANYIIPVNNAYFAGLIDTDGSIVFN
jgi:hypothetical protein